MSKIFTLFITILMISACGSSSNNLVEGNTQVRVEYFGEMKVNTCYPNLTCRIRSNSECVSMLYKEVKKSTQNGLLAIRGKDYAKAAHEFSFALCGIHNIDKLFERMKDDNYEEWKKLRRSGTIENVRSVGVQLSFLIAECEELNEAEE